MITHAVNRMDWRLRSSRRTNIVLTIMILTDIIITTMIVTRAANTPRTTAGTSIKMTVGNLTDAIKVIAASRLCREPTISN